MTGCVLAGMLSIQAGFAIMKHWLSTDLKPIQIQSAGSADFHKKNARPSTRQINNGSTTTQRWAIISLHTNWIPSMQKTLAWVTVTQDFNAEADRKVCLDQMNWNGYTASPQQHALEAHRTLLPSAMSDHRSVAKGAKTGQPISLNSNSHVSNKT